MPIELFQEVALIQDVPDADLHPGDVVTLIDYVPHPTGGEMGCVLEVFNAIGESLSVVTVPLSYIEALRSDEMLSVRPMTVAN